MGAPKTKNGVGIDVDQPDDYNAEFGELNFCTKETNHTWSKYDLYVPMDGPIFHKQI